MNLSASVQLDDQVLARLADEVASRLREHLSVAAPAWLDVNRAAEHLATTVQAIRALVKRDAIPFHKAPNGRLLFHRDELDRWVRNAK